MKQFFTFLLILQLPFILFAQTKNEIDDAVKTFNAGEIDKGISKMEKIKDKEPTDKNWDMLVDMYQVRYTYAQENATHAIVAAIGNTLGAKMETKDYTSPSVCFKDLINKCREATLYSESTKAPQYLRNYLVDYVADTAVNEQAKKEFDKAEDFFEKKDYANSKIHYQNALKLQANYYGATIYLGDSYWYLNDMDSAVYYFRKGITMHPTLMEPRKYIVDALGYAHKNEQATTECFNAIFLYPDQSMFMKYSDLVKRSGKQFNRGWIKRGCEINSIVDATKKAEDSNWKQYQAAKNDIKQYCDSNGIITKQNNFTKASYLEVYSWEKMLANSTDPLEFSFAKRMLKAGILDCYVFISVFHHDLYNQYSDFVRTNKDRIKQYMQKYLVE